jgi:transposase-like protein
MSSVRERYGEAFWRAHHEAWVQSELNQREYCEAYGIPLKAFGNWRAKFKAEPQMPAGKVLYRRRGLSHALSHGLNHGLSHDLRPAIPPAREGRRRKFSEADKRQILEQAILPDACFAEVARRYGIAERVLFRWKQEAAQAAAPTRRVSAKRPFWIRLVRRYWTRRPARPSFPNLPIHRLEWPRKMS